MLLAQAFCQRGLSFGLGPREFCSFNRIPNGLVDYKYVIKVTTDINTYIQPYDEILEYNGLKDIHRNNIGLRYTVDIKDIVGEERKINKL